MNIRTKLHIALLLFALTLPPQIQPSQAASWPIPQPGMYPVSNAFSPDGRSMVSTDTLYPSALTNHEFTGTTLADGTTRSFGTLSYAYASTFWQPDSRGLVVLRKNDFSNAEQQLVRLPLDGSGVQPVTLPFFATCETIPGFTSANCTQLQMLGFAHDASIIYAIEYQDPNSNGPRTFYRADPANPAQPIVLGQVPNISQCQLAAAGYWIVCRTPDQIVRIATSGAIRQDVLFQTPLSFNYMMEWSADGQSLLTWVRPADAALAEIYTIRYADPPAVTRIWQVENSPDQRQPSYRAVISPMGRYVLFNSESDMTLWLAAIGPAGVTVHVIGKKVLSLSGQIQDVKFTADEHWLFYTGACGQQGTPAVCRLDLTDPQQPAAVLTQLAADERISEMITLSADERYLRYAIANATTRSYWSMPVAGTAADRILLAHKADTSFGTFLPFGVGSSWFAIVDGQVVRYSASGVRPPLVLSPVESPLLGYDVTVLVSQGRLQVGIGENYQLVDLGILDGGFVTPALCVREFVGVVQVPIALTTAPVDTRTISYTITAGSADASDYTLPLSGTLQFRPGQMLAHLTIPITTDTLAEGPETLSLQLSADPNSIALQQRDFTLTIREDAACQVAAPFVVRP